MNLIYRQQKSTYMNKNVTADCPRKLVCAAEIYHIKPIYEFQRSVV